MVDLTPGNSYLFDTCVFIDVLNKNVEARKLLFQGRFYPVSVGYSVITESELWVGVNAYPWVSEASHVILLKPFRRYFMNVNIAKRAGALRGLLIKSKVVTKKQEPFLPDCILAATAEFHNLTIVTANTKHFNLFKPHSSISILGYKP